MKNLLLLLMAFLACAWISCSQPKTSTDAATAETKKDSTAAPMPQAEFADAKYTAIGKAAFAALAKKDVDTWSKMFADKAVYYWNSGDSLAGKPAIQAFWTDRMKNVVDSLWFSNEIYLPIKVNKPQA
ncbi:MAG TPA: hypothetical protein VJ508_08470, partial [Saprospiraceae bacterium]|nr:hypothetical protein [Saprospiraceae bacterium]